MFPLERLYVRSDIMFAYTKHLILVHTKNQSKPKEMASKVA